MIYSNITRRTSFQMCRVSIPPTASRSPLADFHTCSHKREPFVSMLSGLPEVTVNNFRPTNVSQCLCIHWDTCKWQQVLGKWQWLIDRTLGFCFVSFVSPEILSRCLQCLCKYNHLNFVHCQCVSDVFREKHTLRAPVAFCNWWHAGAGVREGRCGRWKMKC